MLANVKPPGYIEPARRTRGPEEFDKAATAYESVKGCRHLRTNSVDVLNAALHNVASEPASPTRSRPSRMDRERPESEDMYLRLAFFFHDAWIRYRTDDMK